EETCMNQLIPGYRYSKRILIPLLLTLMLWALVVPSFAQERFGTVAGVVRDSSNAVLPGAAITVKSKDTNRTSTMRSRGDGSYTLPDLEPGRYSAVFEKTGFARSEVSEIVVVVGRTTTVDVELRVGGVQEIVEVSGAPPAIDTTSTMISHNVTLEELNSLPKPRDFTG